MLSNAIKYIIYLSLSIFSCSCAAGFFKPKIETLSSSYEETSNYTENTPLTARIGDVMIIKETGYFHKGFRLSGPISFQDKKAFRGQVWMAGHSYEGSCEEGSMVVTGGAFQKAGLGVVINAEGEVHCPSPIVSIADDETKGDAFTPEEETMPSFIPMKGGIPDYEQGAKRTVMMYGGHSDNAIFVFYREFDGNPFFPTKSQDLSFQLDESKTFEFDGVTYRVLSIQGSTIEFEAPGVNTRDSEESDDLSPLSGTPQVEKVNAQEAQSVEGKVSLPEDIGIEQQEVGSAEENLGEENLGEENQREEELEEMVPEDLFPVDPDAKG